MAETATAFVERHTMAGPDTEEEWTRLMHLARIGAIVSDANEETVERIARKICCDKIACDVCYQGALAALAALKERADA